MEIRNINNDKVGNVGYTQPSHQLPKEPHVQQQEIHYGNNNIKVTVELDSESFEILQNASDIYSDTIINAGIKLFSKSNMYKELMSFKKEDTKAEENLNESVSIKEAVQEAGINNSGSDSNNNTNNSNVSNVNNLNAAKVKSGFSSWG